ncbi:MAG: FAD-binding oxidoreductase [Chloroflexi bacterium]|nr:FAD-binding oxidoreductase [Chloroflexota bacterium]
MELSPSNHDAELHKNAEVVIVGGGVIGTAVAYFLAKDGIDVCLVEQHDIGAGTSSAAAVAALLQTKTSAHKLALAHEGLNLLDDLHEQFEHQFEYKHSGSLLVANSEAEMEVVENMSAKLHKLGLKVQSVSSEDAREIIPFLGPNIVGASYSPRDAIINPLTLVIAYTTAARRLGAVILPFTKVLDIETDGDSILSILTSNGRIHTSTIINAAGVWSAYIAGMVAIDLPVSPLKGELMITQPQPPMMEGTLISAKYLLSKAKLEKSKEDKPLARSVGITLAQVERGNFVIGSTREQAGFDRSSSYAGIRELACQLQEIAPHFSTIHLLRTYAGLRPITPDGLPIIGRVPHLPGFIIAAGHGGDGLALSAITAVIISQIIHGTADEEKLRPFAYGRFTQKSFDGKNKS